MPRRSPAREAAAHPLGGAAAASTDLRRRSERQSRAARRRAEDERRVAAFVLRGAAQLDGARARRGRARRGRRAEARDPEERVSDDPYDRARRTVGVAHARARHPPERATVARGAGAVRHDRRAGSARAVIRERCGTTRVSRDARQRPVAAQSTLTINTRAAPAGSHGTSPNVS
ncbi:hypothetical protein F01_410022 [Burkholderia cenocepacia]|nr:hypothetical protein F01_410022 [Burkholderia cenocepacia]